jgi:hypothetical protein
MKTSRKPSSNNRSPVIPAIALVPITRIEREEAAAEEAHIAVEVAIARFAMIGT